jgi:hypothetical protein
MLTEKTSKLLIGIGIFLIIVGGIVFGWNAISFDLSQTADGNRIGLFGDFIGGIVGSIWALAGVILFYVALQSQKTDILINQQALKQQIKEFELQRVELAETRKVFELQSETLRIQQFESTFFNMINIQFDIVSSTQISKMQGKIAYRHYYQSLGARCHMEKEQEVLKGVKETEDHLIASYEPYFTHLKEMMLFVDSRSDLNSFKYMNIIRSILSHHEVLVLFYYALEDRIYKSIFEKYGFFDGLNINDLFLTTHRKFYKEKAYLRSQSKS